MAYVTPWKLKKNSVHTTLSSGITNSAATIPVTDLTKFYDKDGVLILKGIVIGYLNSDDTITEEITITGASGTSGAGNLTGATRGVLADGSIGAGHAWDPATEIAVMFSTTVYETIIGDIADLQVNKAPITFSDYRTLYPQGSMIPSVDPASVVDQYETSANKNNYIAGLFTDGGTEELQWRVDFPDDWNGENATNGKIIITPIWTAASGSGTVKWVITGKLFANDDAIDTALAAIGNSTDTLITAEDEHVGPATTGAVISPVTPGQNGKGVIMKVTRDSANDTLNATARLIALRLKYIRTQAA